MEPQTLARAHGLYNVLNGLWPLLHMASFEAVSGPKADRWLVRTVAGLLVTVGAAQLAAGSSPAALRQARLLGIGTAGTLGTISLLYGARGRISRIYLWDVPVEGAWAAAWAAARTADRGTAREADRDKALSIRRR